MVYRQRATALDDFLLQVLFPWLVTLHLTPFLRLARIWNEPVQPRQLAAMALGRPAVASKRNLTAKLKAWNFTSSIGGTFHPVKHEQSSVS
jgi:hypothetical protein